MRFFFYIFFLLFPFLFLGAEEEIFPVVWEPSNGAEKLWTTPLGAVYRFPLCASPDSVLYCYDHGRDPEGCEFIRVLSNRIEGGILEAPFPKARKKGLREKRYVSIEFYIRAFPGCQKAESGHFDIRLLNSPQQIRGAAYESLNSILHLNSRDSHLKFTSSRLRIPSSREFDLMVPPYRRPRFSPEFEPVGIRVIYDIVEGKLSVEYNGKRMPFRKVENVRGRTPLVRSFAITTRATPARIFRTEYLEISSPVLRRCGTLEEVEALPPMKFRPYSYADYPLVPKKNQSLEQFVKGHDNPEIQYARALQLLYGGEALCDPDSALALLKKARTRKHALAMYELGVCFWRGYGVEPDFSKARGYLRDAWKLGCRKARVLLYMMEWENFGRPWFESPSLRRILRRYFTNSVSKKVTLSGGYEQNVLFGRIGSSPYTFKSLNARGAAVLLVRSSDGVSLLVDEAIRKKWAYAYFCKYRDCGGGLPLLKEGFRAGDAMLLPKIWEQEFLQSGKLPESEFTRERTLIYGADPLYLALSYLAEHPESPGGAYWRGEAKWPENPDLPSVPKEIRMLYAFYRLSRLQEGWVPGGYKDPPQQNWNPVLRPWFSWIMQAADAGIVQAEVFMGRQWMYGDVFPTVTGSPSEILRRNQARKYLSSAAKKGNVKAALLYSEVDLAEKTSNPGADTRNYLDVLCRLNSGRAWFLKARVFRNMRRIPEFEECCRRAAEQGEWHGIRLLALERKKESEEAHHLWNEFIAADLRARIADKRDFFWPDPYELYGEWENKFMMIPEGDAPKVRYPGAVKVEFQH